MMKAILAVAACFAATTVFAECAPDRVDLRGPWGTASFNVDIAITPEEHGQGLMFVESMPRNKGMLFIFERPHRVSFWMKNTLIPLDMLFIDKSGVVKRVHENAIPHDETSIPGGRRILAVLEVNGGVSSDLGIGEGSEVRHLQMPQDDAAWPCSEP